MIYVKTQIYTEIEVTGIIQLSLDLGHNIISPAQRKSHGKQNTVPINSFLEHPFTLKTGYHVAIFSKLTTMQVK